MNSNNNLIGTSNQELASQLKEYTRLRDLWKQRGVQGLVRNYEQLIERVKLFIAKPDLRIKKQQVDGKTCPRCFKYFDVRSDYCKHTIVCHAGK